MEMLVRQSSKILGEQYGEVAAAPKGTEFMTKNRNNL